jgi:colicin import membrane protein
MYRESMVHDAPADLRSVIYAVLVHVLLVVLLVVGVRGPSRPVNTMPAIQATAITDAETRKEVERRKRQDREQQEQVRRQAEEKQRQEQKRVAEQKRKAEEQRKAEAEKKRQAEEQRKTEARHKRESAERQKAAEQSFREQLAHEEKERAEADAKAKAKAEQAARMQGELARIEALIRQKVERNWVRPAGWSTNMECEIQVRLAPTGEVISATIIRPSGMPAFDRSVENAVYKASPLPVPEDRMLFESVRELKLRFRPEGQR